ncbi:MAG: hypothetical protein WCP31_10320, partial [Chloroflexales bacterium]
MRQLARALLNLSGGMALVVLAACATGPVAGGANAPAAMTTAPPPLSSSVAVTAGPLLAQVAPNLGAPGAVATDVWQLSDLRMLTPATVSALPDGTLAGNYVLVGTATAAASTLVKEGEFQLILSAFWPNKDLPGQPTGTWYVNGNWTITDPMVPTPVGRQRQPPGVVAGVLV